MRLPMGETLEHRFSRRERQIMDAVFSQHEATVNDVVAFIGEPDAYDSVRVTLAILEKKGYLTHRKEDGRNVYTATIERDRARRSAMERLMETFFEGSTSQAILAFMDMSGDRLSDEELDAIAARIEGELEEDRGDDGDDDEGRT